MEDQKVAEIERELTLDEVEKLKKDKDCVTEYKKSKLEKEAQKNWDLFYKRNTTKFFKDRHWTEREFQELSGESITTNKPTLLEIGCGCGNAIFPLIESNKKDDLYVYACDFSPRAVEFVKKNEFYNKSYCKAFQCDVTKDDLASTIKEQSVDIVLMFFVLSAIAPENMKKVIENVKRVLKPGGKILFRDYGLYDHAMLRFAPGHKIEDHFYVRQDGTRAYYFSLDFTKDLLVSCGYNIIENQYILKRTVNKKENIDVPRIFVQGRYSIPID